MRRKEKGNEKEKAKEKEKGIGKGKGGGMNRSLIWNLLRYKSFSFNIK